MGIDQNTLIEVNNKNHYFDLYSYNGGYELSASFSDLVNCFIGCKEYDGTFDQIKDNLDKAKNSIKNIPESASYYSKLKEYYVEANSFYEFCISPTGNYDDAGNKVEDFRTKCQGYKSDLSFDLE